MFDIGVSKLLIVGGIALIVIGPERLPRVARMVGTLVGRAQRYVADVKAEVNRSIELEELKKMKDQFEEAARNVDQTVSNEIGQVTAGLETGWNSDEANVPYAPLPPAYKPPRKKWRLKRAAIPQWYKQRHGVRSHTQSGAARVARFRPPQRG